MILAKQKSEEAKEKEDAAEQDLFSDMAPTIKRQKKIFIGERGSGGGSGAEQGSRLRAVEQDPLVRRMMMVMIMMMVMMIIMVMIMIMIMMMVMMMVMMMRFVRCVLEQSWGHGRMGQAAQQAGSQKTMT